MSRASEEHIKMQELEYLSGSITALPSPMSREQYDYILQLLDTSILATVQKDQVHEIINSGNLTRDHASRIIEALKDQQKNPLDRVKDGELLLQSDLKKAIRKACDDPTT